MHTIARKNNFLREIGPQLYASQFLGLFPNTLISGNPQRSIPLLAYSLCILLTGSAIITYFLPLLLVNRFSNASVSGLVFLFLVMLDHSAFVVTYCTVLFQSQDLLGLMKKFSDLDVMLKYKARRHSPLWKISVLQSSYYYLLLIFLVIFYLMNEDDLYFHEFFFTGFESVAKIAITFQFIDFIYVLRKRFSLITEAIGILSSFEQERGYRNKSPSGSSRCSNVHGDSHRELMRRVRELASCYSIAGEICRDVCQFYGFLVLALFAGGTMEVSVHVYLIISTTFKINFTLQLIQNWVSYLVWVSPLLLTMILSVKACVDAKEEADKAYKSFQWLALRFGARKLQKELSVIASHLDEPPIQFMVNGLFDLNYTLFNSIAATAIGHIAILMQFNLSSKSKEVVS